MRRLQTAVPVGVATVGLCLLSTAGATQARTPVSHHDLAVLFQGQVSSVERADAICEGMAPRAKADCALYVALHVAAPKNAVKRCRAIEDSSYRSECIFQLADRRNDANLCRQAGVFLDDCAQHRWEPPLSRLLLGHDMSSASTVFWEAETLFCNDYERFDSWSAYGERYWRQFFARLWVATPEIDLGDCQPFAGPYRSICEAAALDQIADRLIMESHRPRIRAQICSGLPRLPGVDQDAIGTALPVVREAICVGGATKPPFKDLFASDRSPQCLDQSVSTVSR